MKKKILLSLFLSIGAVQFVSAQEVLPDITVKDFNGKIVVSWQNAYNAPVTNISIQRSFDSTKNYSTIGTVLNPQNLENGFADDNPPYTRMYYRLFISFEGGSYLFSSIARPVKVIPEKKEEPVAAVDDPVPVNPKDTASAKNNPVTVTPQLPRFPWQVNPISNDPVTKTAPTRDSLMIRNHPEIIIYPSLRIYTGRENNVVIHLHDASIKKYTVKFYDENDNFLFELTKLKEEYLIVEKVNFVHSGWFHFELSENGKIIEKNKFYIGKDPKTPNETKRGNNK